MIGDLRKYKGTAQQIKDERQKLAEQFEEAGFQWRGLDNTRKVGGVAYVLWVWTRGDRLIRIKEFTDGRMEVAAFNDEGYLCPLTEALTK